MDGLRTHVACMSLLGCNIMDADFNLVHAKKTIICLLDQVNMVKVLRNVWGNIWINIKNDAFRIKLLSVKGPARPTKCHSGTQAIAVSKISFLSERVRKLPHFPPAL